MADSIDDLLQRMDLTAKVGQLNHPTAHSEVSTGAGAAVADIESRIRRGEVGSLVGGGDLSRLFELQRIAVEESPQGIPLLFTHDVIHGHRTRSEEHTSELQSLMRISYAVFCLNNKKHI